jgi:phage terminase large subunit GpA-like protein
VSAGPHPDALKTYQRWRRDMATRYFAPAAELPPDVWIEANRVLGPPSMSDGPFRWSETPYMRQVFLDFWQPGFTEGAMAKASQVAYTDGLLMNIIGYAAVKRPSSIAMLLPSDLFAEDFSKDKIEPLLEHTPLVGEHFSSLGARDRNATLLNKKMRSGHRLRLFGANSVARLKSFGSEIRLLDEIDEFENDDKQGDPEKLLDRAAYRAKIGRSKKFAGGTPTMFPSRIWKKFLAGNQQRWHLACPVCGIPFPPKWEFVKWEKTTEYHPESAHWCCPNEHHLPPSLHRSLVQRGQWTALNPTAAIPTWHVPGMISLSPSMTLATIATEFLKARKDPAALKVVTNTMFGEPFEDQRERINVVQLRDRRELYEAEVPRGVGLLTMAVDVQRGKRARLEVLIVGWGAAEESWRIHHFRLNGDVTQLTSKPGDPETPWERLDKLRTAWYVHAAGVGLRIASVAIDSADGEMTDVVYQYVKPRQQEGVIAVRGLEHFRGVTRRSRMAEMVKEGKAKDAGVRLILMNTYALKDRLFSRLKPDATARMHWPWMPDDSGEFPTDYFAQFENEARQDVPISKHSSDTESVYIKTGDNEGPDLEVQSMTALYALGGDIVRRLAEMVAEVQARGRTFARQHAETTTMSPGRPPTASSTRPSTGGFHRPR